MSTCATPANTPYGAPAPAGAFPSPPRPQSRSPPAAAKTGAKISPSVQPGSVAARLAKLQAVKPPPAAAAPAERRRRTFASAARARRRADGAAWTSTSQIESSTATRPTTRNALRCGACRRSVVDLAWGTLDGDDVPSATIVTGAAIVPRQGTDGSRSSTRKRTRTNERPSEADVAGIRQAKLRAVELVGDELEQLALTGIAPTCALCGGRFAPSDRIVMQGMVKMHEACMTGSKPAQCNGPRLPPARALKDAPATLVIKVSLGKGVATFYVARVEQEDETCVAYGPDPAARAPPKRRVDVDALAGATVRALSLQGAEVAPAGDAGRRLRRAVPLDGPGPRLALRRALRRRRPKNVVAVDGATLTVTINWNDPPDHPLL